MCANETETLAGNITCATAPNFGGAIGFFYEGNLSAHPVYVPPYTTLDSDMYLLSLLAKGMELADLFAEEIYYGVALSKTNGTVIALVGDLRVPVNWNTDNIPLYLNWSQW
jgi:hypothetical protein